MNTANLQLEGLYLAVASINALLVRKGLLTVEEIDLALRCAESAATGDEGRSEERSSSNRDAIAFPMRLLAAANNSASDGDTPGFSELTRQVGRTKERYNDQR